MSDLTRRIAEQADQLAQDRVERNARIRELEAEREAALERAEQLKELLDRVIEAGVETWHTVVNDEPSLASWLGLTNEEYAAWVEKRDLAGLSVSEEQPNQ